MLNRILAPEIRTIDHIDFVAPEQHLIASGVHLYHMSTVTGETCKIELYFDAGNIREQGATPSLVNGLLLSGSKRLSAMEIQDRINSLGGFYESGLSQENAVVSIYCLREYALDLFHILMEALDELSFEEKEVAELVADKRQKWNINMEKVSFRAQREFQKTLFASDERYGRVSEEIDFQNVDRESLKEFYEKYYRNGLTKVVIVGRLDNTEIDGIIEKSKNLAKSESSYFGVDFQNEKGEFLFEKEGAMQTAIRVGRMLFNKNHSDYLDFLILMTILGDYFGSRLMSNIREDKGYTYGIGAILFEIRESGYFMVGTEVRKDVRDATLKEIRYEFERLQQELVSDDELELVKNYMLGQLLKSADGPYAMTDLFISAELYGKGLEFYNEALRSILHIQPDRIRELAKKYLNWEEMTIVAFG